MLLMGLDLGTTNTKACAYDLGGHTVASATVSYPSNYPRFGWAEQKPVDWTTALTAACQQLMTKLGDRKHALVGIGLSSHGPGLILVDESGLPLLDFSPTWQDERCLEQGQRLLDRVGPSWTGLGAPQIGFPAKLLWAIENYPEAARRARYALGVKDYLVHWLTGEFATEPSSSAGHNAWWTPVFEACAWPLDRLPAIHPSTEVIGRVLPERVSQLGLSQPVPVVMGLNDGASATLSTGAIHAHDAVLTLATNGVLRLVLDQEIPPQTRVDHNMFFWPYVMGLWVGGAQTRTGASALQWFADLFEQGSSSAHVDFETLLDEASKIPPGSNGLTFLPYLIGHGSPSIDIAAKGLFAGLTLSTGRGDLCRAVLEGVAFAFSEIASDFASMNHAISGVQITGGGARSPLWRQILADILEWPLTYFAADSTLGAAIVTAVSMNIYPDFGTAVQHLVHPLGVTIPQGFAPYADAHREYTRLRDLLYPRR